MTSENTSNFIDTKGVTKDKVAPRSNNAQILIENAYNLSITIFRELSWSLFPI